MSSWLDRPGSLNWANEKKLTAQIQAFDLTLGCLEKRLLDLLQNVQEWKNHARALSELSHQQRLTAKHVLQLRPLLEQTEAFQNALNLLSLDKPQLSAK